MDHPDFITCSFMENYIGHKRVNVGALFSATFNPFMPNVFFRPYQLGESISNLRAFRWNFLIFIQI